MKNLHVLILSLLSLSAVYGQTPIIIKGNVKNTQNENMSQILVTIKQMPDSTLLKYAYSDQNGNYELAYSGKESDLLLVASGLGIATQTKKISNQNQIVNFIVKEEEFQLKEVVVKPEKIYYSKDTINYLVSAFSNEKDVVIGDVLKKLPGINVAESGQITYQGQPINKFYIENMDLLNGRYGIATQNISAKDVATVQVMENHQPIKAIDSLRISDQAAINLKLKEGAKGAFGMMAQLGIGAAPFLWNDELTGMYFSRKKQHISAYKTNNTGNDLSNELSSFTSEFNLPTEAVTSILMPAPPDINKSRYFFNNSHAATVNNLFNLGKDKELNFNLIYYNDYEKRQNEAVSSYYINNDSILKIDEMIRSAVNTNRIEAEVRYNKNREAHYFNNLLNVEGSWENRNGIIRNQNPIDQEMYRPSFKVQNILNWINRLNNGGFELYSQTGFRNTPHNLTITPGIYTDWLNDGVEYAHLRQDASIQTFISKNNLRFLTPFRLGQIVLHPIFGVNAEINNLTSELYPCNEQYQPIAIMPDSMKNDIRRSHLQVQAGLNLDYKIGTFKFNAFFPVNYDLYRLDNKLFQEDNETLNRFHFEPLLGIQYVLSRKITIGANASISQGMNGIYELYNGYILQTYRYLNHFNSQLAGLSHASISAKIGYKDIIRMFFADLNVAYYLNKNSITYSQLFEDYLSVLSSVYQPNSSNTIGVAGKANKGFDWMRLTADASFTYVRRTAQQVRQEQLVDYRNNQYSVAVRLSAAPATFLIISYSGTGQTNRSIIAGERAFLPIRSFTQSLNVDCKLFNKVMLGTHVEQYVNSAIQNGKSLFFADLFLTHTWKQMRFELNWTNIFDTKNYMQAYYDNLNEYASVYRIRPSEVVLKVKMKLK